MKKVISIFILLLLCFISNVPFVAYADEIFYVRVIMNKTYVFKTAEYQDDVSILSDEDYITVRLNEKLELADDVIYNDIRSESMLTYYKVVIDSFDNGYGYVLEYHVLPDEIRSLESKIDYNARINKDNVKAYELISNTYFEIENIVLNKGDNIKILEFYDMSKTYLECMILINENPTVVYIERYNIEQYGISSNVIIAIIIIIACIVVAGVICYYLIKKRKKENQK